MFNDLYSSDAKQQTVPAGSNNYTALTNFPTAEFYSNVILHRQHESNMNCLNLTMMWLKVTVKTDMSGTIRRREGGG